MKNTRTLNKPPSWIIPGSANYKAFYNAELRKIRSRIRKNNRKKQILSCILYNTTIFMAGFYLLSRL